MARSLVNGRNLQHWDVKVMHFSFSYDAPITACARNSRNYTYFLTKYTRYLQVTYLAEKYIEIWHNTYISCCVCMYVCNRMYIRIRIVLYPYTNFWHDSHKTYQNIFHMRENFGHGPLPISLVSKKWVRRAKLDPIVPNLQCKISCCLEDSTRIH